MSQFVFEAIGTHWQIDIFETLTPSQEKAIFSKILSRIEEFDKTYSRFREDSLVTKISQIAGDYVFPMDSKKLFEIYYDLYKKTEGFFTPLVGNLLSDAGYDAVYTLKQKTDLVAPPKWENVLEYKDYKLTTKTPLILDFGAGGKGYLVDIIAHLLEENSITKYCIDGSGDILYKNNESMDVGLENPFDLGQVIGISHLKNKSICGSAGTRRKWGEFTHIINPHSLSSPKDIVAVWVIHESAFIADCLATCLFFVEPKNLLSSYDFEYVIVKSDHSVLASPSFEGQIF